MEGKVSIGVLRSVQRNGLVACAGCAEGQRPKVLPGMTITGQLKSRTFYVISWLHLFFVSVFGRLVLFVPDGVVLLVIPFVVQLSSWEDSPSAVLWPSRGHRFRPISRPVAAFIAITHKTFSSPILLESSFVDLSRLVLADRQASFSWQ